MKGVLYEGSAALGSRINGAHFLAIDHVGRRVDQDKSDDRWDRAPIDPGVYRAALDDDVAGFQMYDLTIVEFAVNLAGQQDCVVHGFGAVRESRIAGSEFVIRKVVPPPSPT